MIFTHWTGKISVRTQRHRLDSTGKLFDMETDPGQDRDIAKEQPEVAARLSKAVADWRQEMLPGLKNDDRPFPWAILSFLSRNFRPATACRTATSSAAPPRPTAPSSGTGLARRLDHLGRGSGHRRSLRSCHLLHLPAGGSRLHRRTELQWQPDRGRGVGGQRPAHARRGKRSRPAQGESYVKDFKPLRLGVIELKTGRGPLTLRSLNMPGKQVMTCGPFT